MSEFEPTLPYATTYVQEWAIQHGVDANEYESSVLRHGEFLVAKLRSQELSQEFLFLKEIEAVLGLENCKLIDNPRQIPGEWKMPKVYVAPEGTAFEITTAIDDDDWNPTYDDADNGFLGRYLEIEDLYILSDGTRRATVVVRGELEPYAVQVEDWGDSTTG